jgi:hypothetical protein
LLIFEGKKNAKNFISKIVIFNEKKNPDEEDMPNVNLGLKPEVVGFIGIRAHGRRESRM